MRKWVLTLALVMVMLINALPAAALEPVENEWDWTCYGGNAEINVIAYAKSLNGFVENDCVSGIVGEKVFYAIRLTVPSDANKQWYETMAESGIKVEYTNLSEEYGQPAAEAIEYFVPPEWEDAKGGTEWYLKNTAVGTAEAEGGTDSSIWVEVDKFSDESCVWEKYSSEVGSKVKAMIESDSDDRLVYYCMYHKITLGDGVTTTEDTLSSYTFEDLRTGDVTVIRLDGKYRPASIEIVYEDKTYSVEALAEDEQAFIAVVDGERVSLPLNCEPGSKLYDLFNTFNLNFGSNMTWKYAHLNFGWDWEQSSAYVFSIKDITATPVFNPDYCYTGSPIMTITNYDELAGATFKLYKKGPDGEYAYDDDMTEAIEFLGSDVFRIKAAALEGQAFPIQLALSATRNGCGESALAAFEVRQPEKPEEGETITDALPPDQSNNGENSDSGETSGVKPAEILMHGPVVRDDINIAPGIEITKYDADEIKELEGYEEMKGYINNNKQGYAYYDIDLKNAEIKDDAEMEIRFYFGEEHENKKVWVLHLCSKHDKIEKHEDLKVDEEGFVTIKVHSFSPFIIGFDNTPDMPISSGRSSGTDVKYNGGNSFSTSNSAVPTSVEIDGVPVSFSGDGRNFTVDCIDANARRITVRWHSASVTVNFTPDSSAVCGEIIIPKTGDVTVFAYAAMSVMAAVAVMGGKR